MTAQDRKYMTPTEDQLKQVELFPERAQEKRIADLERENRELRAKLEDAEKPKKKNKSEFSVKELEEMIADQRRVIGEQADKLRSPQNVKPLCEAIEILTAAVKMVSPENYKQDYPHMMTVEDYREGHRQLLCDAIDAAERLYREVFCSVPCVPEWLFGNPDLPRLWRDFKSTGSAVG